MTKTKDDPLMKKSNVEVEVGEATMVHLFDNSRSDWDLRGRWKNCRRARFNETEPHQLELCLGVDIRAEIQKALYTVVEYGQKYPFDGQKALGLEKYGQPTVPRQIKSFIRQLICIWWMNRQKYPSRVRKRWGLRNPVSPPSPTKSPDRNHFTVGRGDSCITNPDQKHHLWAARNKCRKGITK